jgi:hypothetical protein
MEAQPDDAALLREKLNLETGRIAWTELQRPFARGVVIRVGPSLDLVEVASCFARDDKDAVAAWLAAATLAKADADDARAWQQREAQFWALVVAPWVLVQEITH